MEIRSLLIWGIGAYSQWRAVREKKIYQDIFSEDLKKLFLNDEIADDSLRLLDA